MARRVSRTGQKGLGWLLNCTTPAHPSHPPPPSPGGSPGSPSAEDSSERTGAHVYSHLCMGMVS